MSSPSLPLPPGGSPPPSAALAGRLEGMNLYLVGMMGAGKTSVGRPLAAALGYRFVDADAVLEGAAGRTIPEVFAAEGETGFRDLETAVLNRIAGWHSLVVATGGGVVTRPVNWGQLHQGLVVWLDAPETLLLERLSADPGPRPLMTTTDPTEDPATGPALRLRGLLAQRRPLYAQADLRILQDGRPAAEVARQVLEALPAVLRPRQAPPQVPLSLIEPDGALGTSLN